MIIYNDKKECSGCTACFSICPKQAIDMVEDEKGFKYPEIDDNKCINCNLCIKVCPLKKELKDNQPLEVYAVKNRNEEVRARSSSGGFFNEISKYVIKNGGYVFGAVYDENFDVYHYGTNDIKENERFKGSKYVKSDVKNTYNEVKVLLNKNIMVLYSGTPCQIDGLKQYLKNINQENLITCDNVCHGTPSPKIFREFKKELENNHNSKIKEFTFRYKVNESTQNIYALFENGSKYIGNSAIDKYYKLFLKNINLRDCCFDCHYSNTKRVGDFSIADFWGIEKSIQNFDDKKGVSLVLINTEKAKSIFSLIKENLDVRESNISDALQTNLIHPSVADKNKDEFWKCYLSKGYNVAVKKYTKIKILMKIKTIGKSILSKLGVLEKVKRIGGKNE